MLGRAGDTPGEGEGAGSNFADGKYIRWVLGSSAIVRAPRSVFKVWITVNFPGATSLAIVVVPSPQVANASCVVSSNAQPSTPAPIGTVSTTFPLSVSSITIILLWQPENKRWCGASNA